MQRRIVLKRMGLVVLVFFLAGLAVLGGRPGPAVASRLAQSTAYPPPGTTSPLPTETLVFGETPNLTGTPDDFVFSPEPPLAGSAGPNLFKTEDAAIFDAFATLAGSQTLPATRTPTVTRTATSTRTPTATRTPTLTFTPSATGSTATPTASANPTAAVTLTAAPGATSRSMDWKVFGIGFSIPILVVAAGALVIYRTRARGQ